MLSINKINAYYGKLKVLHDLNLSVQQGERIGIFGHNGAGKTSLLKCCVGELETQSGQIDWAGQRVVAHAVHLNTRMGIGFVPQGNNVFKDLSVKQNLHIAGLMHDPGFVTEIYQVFPILRDRQNQMAGTLSGGQQQMLGLGMAMMRKPHLLLLDEPTTGLAPIIVKDVLNAVRRISDEQGMTLMMVEQNVQATLAYVDRAIVLKSGRIIFDDTSLRLRQEESLWHLF
ncbi:MAG: ABC transporter ATP-binding protein [Betaproteobacteria bacterium]|nr:ABC transporter ATP-binding protein [Betaproteobacteria bacterium]